MEDKLINNSMHETPVKTDSKGAVFLYYAKQIALAFVGYLGLQIFATILQIVLLVRGILTYGLDTESAVSFLLDGKNAAIVNFGAYAFLVAALLLIIFKDLPKLFPSFAKIDSYGSAVVGWLVLFGFNIAYGMILNLFKLEMSDNVNETAVTNIVSLYPTLSLIVFGIVGPLCEEITYRLGLFSFFRRKYKVAAYVITMIIFGFIHFDFTAASITNELLNLPLYVGAGFILTYLYDHYGFASSTLAHIMNNVISILLTINTSTA